MNWTELVETLCKVTWLIVATAAMRDIYFKSELFAGLRAWCETAVEISGGPKWLFARLLSCPVCLTYWFGICVALCLWPLASLGGMPSWVLDRPIQAADRDRSWHLLRRFRLSN